MVTAENLKGIIDTQKEVLKQLETEYHMIKNGNSMKDSVKIKAELEKLRTDYDEVCEDKKIIEDENMRLKNALYEQIYNEKRRIINMTSEKIKIYFQSNVPEEINRLTNLENNVRYRIDQIAKSLKEYNIQTKDEIYEQLDRLSIMLDERVTQIRVDAAKMHPAFSKEQQQELEELCEEPLSNLQVEEAVKKNNMERFVGLNLLNVVGIFLIIIGVITASRYTYVRLPDTLRGIMMFVLGGFMLCGGEFMNRKKANSVAIGITAGGVAILYVANTISYFELQILSMYPALLLSILITMTAIILSQRYHSQVIMAFALIGGYFPMYSITITTEIMYGAMIYFVILNILALSESFLKGWSITPFIGLVLNILGTIYICFYYGSGSTIGEKIILILFVFFAFLVYTSIPVVSTYRLGGNFRTIDIALLTINTGISSLMMYGVFYMLKLDDYYGLLAIMFAVVYLVLGWITEKKFAPGNYAKVLFYLTGLAFVVLIIPLQYGYSWLSMGWLAEGTAITIYAVLYQNKRLKEVGYGICGLCVAAFLLSDCMMEYLGEGHLFIFKYTMIVVSSLLILSAYMYKKTMTGVFVKYYKYVVFANLWVYMFYLVGRLYNFLYLNYGFYIGGENELYSIQYLMTALIIILTFIVAFIMLRVKLLSDAGTKKLAAGLYLFGIIGQIIVNIFMRPINIGLYKSGELVMTNPSIHIMVTGTLIILVLGLFSLYAVHDLMKLAIKEYVLKADWYPIILSVYLAGMLTMNLMIQYELSFSNTVFTILLALTALVWIIFGFKQHYSFIRRFGLGMSLLSVIKLFLMDMSGLSQGYRIVSYFALGVTLVAISFVYQYFSKRMELFSGENAGGEHSEKQDIAVEDMEFSEEEISKDNEEIAETEISKNEFTEENEDGYKKSVLTENEVVGDEQENN